MHLPELLTPYADEYTKQWISSSPLFPMAFLLAYWGFHWLYIPDLGQPNDYRQNWSICKNALILVANVWLTIVIANTAQRLNYDVFCEPVDPISPKSPVFSWADWNGQKYDSKIELRHYMKDLSFFFLLVKMVECLDTVVTSMRGILYHNGVFAHHSAMIFFAWLAIVFVPAGTTSIILMASSFGHVLDYLFLVAKRCTGNLLAGKAYLVHWYNLGQLVVVTILSISSGYQECGYPFPASFILFCATMAFSILEILMGA